MSIIIVLLIYGFLAARIGAGYYKRSYMNTIAPKGKITLNLKQEHIDLIEGMWIEFRSKYKKKKVTKSEIVEWAILNFSREIQVNGLTSAYIDFLHQRSQENDENK